MKEAEYNEELEQDGGVGKNIPDDSVDSSDIFDNIVNKKNGNIVNKKPAKNANKKPAKSAEDKKADWEEKKKARKKKKEDLIKKNKEGRARREKQRQENRKKREEEKNARNKMLEEFEEEVNLQDESFEVIDGPEKEKISDNWEELEKPAPSPEELERRRQEEEAYLANEQDELRAEAEHLLNIYQQEQERQRLEQERHQQEQERQRQEQERQREEEHRKDLFRNEYEDHKRRFKISIDKGFKNILDVYGPNGKVPQSIGYPHPEEYDDIHLEVPQGLTDELVAAIVLGAALSKSRLDRDLSSSTNRTDVVSNNQMHFLVNVIEGDTREKKFVPIMVQAKKEAAAAIKKYKEQGDDKDIKKLLHNYANYAANNSTEAYAAEYNQAEIKDMKLGQMFCQKYVIDGKFKVKPAGTDVTKVQELRLMSYSKQMEAFKKAETSKLKLIDEAAVIDGEDKEKLVEDMILDTYISYIATRNRYNTSEKINQNRMQAFKNVGINPGDPIWAETGNQGVGKVGDAANKAYMAYSRNQITDLEAIMGAPHGRENIKNAYLDAIKNSDIYRNIMNANTRKGMIDALMALDHDAIRGMDVAFPDVHMPKYAYILNDKRKETLNKELADVRKEVVKAAFEGPLVMEMDEMGYNSLSPRKVKENAEQIDELYGIIKGNNYRGGSRNYKDMKDKLKELRDYTKKLAGYNTTIGEQDIVKYKKLADEFDTLADKYLMEKDNINSEYARTRVKGVKNAKLKVAASVVPVEEAIEGMIEGKTEELIGDKLDVFDKYIPYNDGNPFFGNKYRNKNELMLPFDAKGYTLGRTGGISVAIMALAATGQFTLEDLMDPSRLVNEKAQMFDKVANAMKNSSKPENQKWIAEQIYKGQKATDKIFNDEIKNIDFSDPNPLQNSKIAMVSYLQAARFDAEQELTRCCEAEYVAVAQQDDPTIQGPQDIKISWSPLMNLTEAVRQMKREAPKAATEKDPEVLLDRLSKVMAAPVRIRMALDYMNKTKEEKGNIPYKDWFTIGGTPEYTQTYNGIPAVMSEKLGSVKTEPNMVSNVMPKILDGTYLKDTKIVHDPENMTARIAYGFPSKERMMMDSKNVEFLKKTDAALRRLEQGNYPNKKDFVMDSAYAVFGQMYREAGGKMPIDGATGRRMTLDDYMARQLKSGTFERSLRSKQNPKQYTDPKNVAKMAKNPEKIRGLIKKNVDAAKAKNNKKSKDTNISRKNSMISNSSRNSNVSRNSNASSSIDM
ncbi:MAG: hypothetical protein K6E28_03715 [Eubacterium sp.]|nr:hypothetical protein [Eubacterium sp.]